MEISLYFPILESPSSSSDQLPSVAKSYWSVDGMNFQKIYNFILGWVSGVLRGSVDSGCHKLQKVSSF